MQILNTKRVITAFFTGSEQRFKEKPQDAEKIYLKKRNRQTGGKTERYMGHALRKGAPPALSLPCRASEAMNTL